MSRRRQRTGAARRCRAAPVFNCIAVAAFVGCLDVYVARARSFTRSAETGYMRARSVRSVWTGDAVFVILWDAKATVPLGAALSNVHGCTRKHCIKHPTAREKGPQRPIHRSKDEVRVASAPRGHRKDKYTTRRHPPPSAGEAVASRAHVCSHVGNAPHSASLEPQIITGSWSSGK